jgi:hypothetical protein
MTLVLTLLPMGLGLLLLGLGLMVTEPPGRSSPKPCDLPMAPVHRAALWRP